MTNGVGQTGAMQVVNQWATRNEPCSDQIHPRMYSVPGEQMLQYSSTCSFWYWPACHWGTALRPAVEDVCELAAHRCINGLRLLRLRATRSRRTCPGP
jgi:hypothetical protein